MNIIIREIVNFFDSKNILGIKFVRGGKISSFRSKSVKSMRGLSKVNAKQITNSKYQGTNITQININHSLGLEGIKLLVNTRIN